jgi:hypothetical protein
MTGTDAIVAGTDKVGPPGAPQHHSHSSGNLARTHRQNPCTANNHDNSSTLLTHQTANKGHHALLIKNNMGRP